MNYELFASLLQHLLHTHVLITDREQPSFLTFEEKYCYSHSLQPAFTNDSLLRIAGELQEKTLYGLQDDLGICIIFFILQDKIMLVGPYVRSQLEETKLRQVLISRHFPASFATSIRIYGAAFPVISSTYVRNTITAFIGSFSGKSEDYIFCRLSADNSRTPLPQPLRRESLDYSALHQRYDLENNFLRMIQLGDTENVLPALQEMSLLDMKQNRYVNAVYQEPGIGLAMTRALARKAAEQGGASLVEIHEITQRAVQKISSSRDAMEQARYSDAMVLELTEAVRRNKQNLLGYSKPIRRVIQHIQLNYSQEMSLSMLADIAGISESYLIRLFKKEAGSSVFQYIAFLRCRHAAEMLENQDIPVQEISSYVGYEDNNYFVKVFRKQYGMTPTEYRSQHR